jgi:hypothetical protein
MEKNEVQIKDSHIKGAIPGTSPNVQRDGATSRTTKLIRQLEARNFDCVNELLSLYYHGTLKDDTKTKIIFELMQYLYPKLKSVDMTGNIQIDKLVTEIKFIKKEVDKIDLNTDNYDIE